MAIKRRGPFVRFSYGIVHILLTFLVFWLGYKLFPNPLSFFGFIIIREPITASAVTLLYYFFGGIVTIFLLGDVPMILLGLVYRITDEPFDFTVEKIGVGGSPSKKNSN